MNMNSLKYHFCRPMKPVGHCNHSTHRTPDDHSSTQPPASGLILDNLRHGRKALFDLPKAERHEADHHLMLHIKQTRMIHFQSFPSMSKPSYNSLLPPNPPTISRTTEHCWRIPPQTSLQPSSMILPKEVRALFFSGGSTKFPLRDETTAKVVSRRYFGATATND
jgi:hypothetical protein